MLTVRVPAEREAEAIRVIDQVRAISMAERGAAFRQSGWQRFDETAPPQKPINRDFYDDRANSAATKARYPKSGLFGNV